MLQGYWTNEFGPTGTANAGIYADKSYWLATHNWDGQNYPFNEDLYSQVFTTGFANGYVPVFVVVGYNNKIHYNGNFESYVQQAVREAIYSFPPEGGGVPETPTNVVINHDGSSVSLDWDLVTGAEQYYIYGKSDPYDESVFLDSTANTMWTTPGMGDKYFFEIKSKNNTSSNSADMVFVQGGTFQMGDHFNEGSANELPVHSVTVNDFHMGATEVTQSEWSQYMPVEDWSSYGTGDDYPAYSVDWYEIMVYCNRRSMVEGITPCYTINGSTYPAVWGAVPTSWSPTWDAAECNWSANGYRLPTEAEWEYAARGGIHNADNYHYSGSDTIGDVAWYDGNNDFSKSKPVGTKLPNQLGIYDMSGNLWEWCWDMYDSGYYAGSPSDNPTGPTSGYHRVVRGGYWYNFAEYCRVADRLNNYPYGSSYYYMGFRVSRTP